MSSKNKPTTHHWDNNRNTIHSRKGGWKMGEAIYSHGYSLMDELVGEVSYFQVYLMNIFGYLPEKRLADWAEAIHICMSWPDPRIWCNQIGALGGTAKTEVVGATVAGILAADSVMYGSKPLLYGVDFIQQAQKKFIHGQSVAEIVEHEVKAHRGKVRITGFARPLATGDERIVAMKKVTKKLNFTQGEHMSLAFSIEDYLLSKYQESMNINGYVSAFMADQGLTPEQAYQMSSLTVMSGVAACYVEESTKPAGSFLPLKCSDIDYQGKAPRSLP